MNALYGVSDVFVTTNKTADRDIPSIMMYVDINDRLASSRFFVSKFAFLAICYISWTRKDDCGRTISFTGRYYPDTMLINQM
jgi:hypothetical protein